VPIQVFIHKVDGLSEETKMEAHQHIYQRVLDDLIEVGMDGQIHVK
jgi:hypothetical protein